ncbi:MAG: phosphatase PAP2 family protein [Sphingomonadaceae bacterium]|nr:phosphatase PAP2 family protein [Sphingomonadaceae bacterium]
MGSRGSAAAEFCNWRRVAILAGLLCLVAGLLIWRCDPALDRAIHMTLLVQPGAGLSRMLIGLTNLGGGTAMIPLGLGACALLLWRGERGAALWLFATVASGRIVVEAAKHVFDRPRPPAGDWLTRVDSYSMPSSHSAGTMLTLLAICAAFGASARWRFAALAFAVAIGATRIVLGVHWPSDVLAGWGFALLWMGAAIRWMPQASFSGVPYRPR